MDTNSSYEILTTQPSTLNETFSIETLIQRVEEFQKRDQLESLERVTRENFLLQRRLVRYQEYWCSTLDLLQKAHEVVQSMHNALEKYTREEIAAERDWLAFWGIKMESTKDLGYSPGGWI